jgi:hypothetical protein
MFSAFCNEETKVIPGGVGKKQPEDNAWTDHPKTPIRSRDNFLAERIPAAHTSMYVHTGFVCVTGIMYGVLGYMISHNPSRYKPTAKPLPRLSPVHIVFLPLSI